MTENGMSTTFLPLSEHHAHAEKEKMEMMKMTNFVTE